MTVDERIVGFAMEGIRENIQRRLELGVWGTYYAIIQCCIDLSEQHILLSELMERMKYLPNIPLDYSVTRDIQSDLEDLEYNIGLITTSANGEGDLIIYVRGMGGYFDSLRLLF